MVWLKKGLWRHWETSISISFIQQKLTECLLDIWYCLHPTAMEMNESGLLPSSSLQPYRRWSGDWKGSKDKRGNWGNLMDVKEAVSQNKNSCFSKCRSQNAYLQPCSSFPHKPWKWLPWTKSPLPSTPLLKAGLKFCFKKINSSERRSVRREGDWLQRYSLLECRNPRFLAFLSKSSVFRILRAPTRSLYPKTWISGLSCFPLPQEIIGNFRFPCLSEYLSICFLPTGFKGSGELICEQFCIQRRSV